jgi:N-acyl-D-aspartate/D-glutamate deacylase
MPDFDIIVRGGTVVDGTGAARYVADLGIVDGRIAAIGELKDRSAGEIIDAGGRIVAPGIIDPHTHYDAQIHWDPYCTNSGWHGVTTVMVGNCGFGYAPCRAGDRDRYMHMMESTEQIPAAAQKSALSWDWETYPEWVQHMRRVPKGVNVASYLPLNSLLMWVLGPDAAKSRAATDDERAEMRRLLHEAMDNGAVGFGFSFLQEQNSHKDADGSAMPTDSMHIEEAYTLAQVLRERGEGIIQALVELPSNSTEHHQIVEKLAQISGRPVLHNVIAAFDAFPAYHQSILDWLDKVHAEGELDIYSQALALSAWNEYVMDDYNIWVGVPYFNEFQSAGDAAAKTAKARDVDYRDRLREQYRPEHMIAGGGPIENLVLVNASGSDRFGNWVGSSLGAIAEAESAPVTDVLLDLLAETEMKAETKSSAVISTNPDFIADMIGNPRVLAGTSDGGAHIKFFSGGQFGTEMITWLVREEGRFTLEQMHQKLSQLPARAVGFNDRGELLEGYAADLFVYDYDRLGFPMGQYDIVHDLPNGDWRRVCPAVGISAIVVNGQITFTDGECTRATPGRLISNGGRDTDRALLD